MRGDYLLTTFSGEELKDLLKNAAEFHSAISKYLEKKISEKEQLEEDHNLDGGIKL
jgi:hypothetical protein